MNLPLRLEVSIDKQSLRVMQGQRTVLTYLVSTSAHGIGFEPDSHRTPVGRFRISEKIGAGAPIGTIFRSRQPVGIWHPSMHTDHDLILTRILRLDGIDARNRNSHERFIYLHGTNQESRLGQPDSLGCVRLANRDIIELFDLIPVGTEIAILPPARSDLKLLFLDGDQMLTSASCLHELAAIANVAARSEAGRLLDAASRGKTPWEKVFPRCLDLLRPDRATCRKVADAYLTRIAPGAIKALAAARALGWTPVIVSGGLLPVIAPLARHLGIHHLEAVPVRHSNDGHYEGYAPGFPTTRSNGKAVIVREWLDLVHPQHSAMLGTQITDVGAGKLVNTFIAYLGTACHRSVIHHAAKQVKSFNSLPLLLRNIESPISHSPPPTKKTPSKAKIFLANNRNCVFSHSAMSAKKKGIRYTPQKKAEVVAFVNSYNAKHGRGGQSKAAAKYGITQLTIAAWLKKSGKAPKKAAPAKRGGRKPGPGKKAPAAGLKKIVKDLQAAVAAAAKALAKV